MYIQAVDVIIDVSGIIKNAAIPLSIILVNSIANIFELIIAEKLYWKSWKNKNRVINPPRYAKNNVFVVVPNMSFPMFIPDTNNSFLVSFGLFKWTSYRADDIAIEVSFIFPIRPIRIIHCDKTNILIPVL